MNTKQYYRGRYSLYYWCEFLGLSGYQFDLLKRLFRKKGEEEEDIVKTRDLLKIIIAEHYHPKSIPNWALVKNFIKDWELTDAEQYVLRLVLLGDWDMLLSITNTALIKD